MADHRPDLQTLLFRTGTYDQDEGFRATLRRVAHQGMKWAGIVGLVGELCFVGIHVLLNSPLAVLPASSDAAETIILFDDLYIAGMSGLCLVFAWRRCTLSTGRGVLAGMLLSLVVVTQYDNILYGTLQDPGYLTVIYMLGVVAVPFRPWQALGLGGGMIGLLLSIPLTGSLPEGLSAAPIYGQLPLLGVVTALMTGITVILYANRWSEYQARQRTQEALDEHRLLLRTTQEMGNIGGWQFDLESSSLSWTRQVYRIYDHPPEEEPDLNALLSPYPSEARTSLRTALVQCMETGEAFELELPLQTNGESRWVEIRGDAVEREQDTSQIVGTIQDVTIRRKMAEDLREREKWLRSITQNISDGLYRSTPDEGVVYANDAFVSMFGYDAPEDLYALDPAELYADPEQRAPITSRLEEQGRLHQVEIEFRRNDGSTFIGLLSSMAVEDEDGDVQYYDGAVTDITERKKQEEQLRRRQSKIEALYAAMGALLQTEDRDEVAAQIEALVIDTLDYPLNTVRFVEDGRLIPVRNSPALHEHMPERPVYDTSGESPAARAYRSGDTIRFNDVREASPDLDIGDARAAAYVPIDGHGVISVATLESGAINSFDVRLLEILAGNAAVVLDRSRRVRELVDAKERAEAANELKSAFLANMSHEIRTPLTSIIGFAEAIGDTFSDGEGEETPESTTRFAHLIEKSGRRLLDTLNSVLDLSQLEAGSMQLTPEPLDVRDHIREAVDLFEPRAESAGVALDAVLPGRPLPAHTDGSALQRILHNLLSNAVKFTKTGGTVEVRAEAEEDGIVVAVADTGIGIDPEFRDELFEPFKQGSSGTDRTHEGSGLGLAVTKQLVDHLDGTIDVDSTPGEGTVISIRLPAAE